MEHSYSRDWRPSEGGKALSTRTVMIHKAPQCPSCHLHSMDEIDLEEPYNPPIPSYNCERAKEAMETIGGIVKKMRNHNSEEDDWEMGIDKLGWTVAQQKLFGKVSRILSTDRLARLAHEGQQHVTVLRRADIDKSVQRMRQALAGVGWDPKLTQWIHGLMMDQLPQSYLTAYLDILQTLKSKLPTLVDKMMFGRSWGAINEALAPVIKEPWEPVVNSKIKKLPNQPIIILMPSNPNQTSLTPRQQDWFALFAVMGTVIPIQIPENVVLTNFSIDSALEHLVSITRARIHEIRKESNNRPIVLVGFNAGASLALQVGLLEAVKSIVCMGFSFNTFDGVRGYLDDQILDLQTPVLFVIGQNSARTNQEEIEGLREQMIAPTSMVVVGSADDALRVSKTKRKIENVTQSMVDNMVVDEVFEFISNCIICPPQPRYRPSSTLLTNGGGGGSVTSTPFNGSINGRKRKQILEQLQPLPKEPKIPKTGFLKNGKPRVTKKKLSQQFEGTIINEVTIIQDDDETPFLAKISPPKKEYRDNLSPSPSNQIITSYDIVPGKITQKINVRQNTGQSGDTVMIGNSQVIGNVSNSSMMLPIIQKQKISMIPTNQFVPLKPMNENGPQLISVKPSKVGQQNSTVILGPGGQIQRPVAKTSSDGLYTITTTPNGNKIYSIRNKANSPIMQNATIEYDGEEEYVQLEETEEILVQSEENPDLNNTSILDLPIVFADSDGNIQEHVEEVHSQQLSAKPIILSNQPIMLTSSGTNKLIYIKNMKPNQPNILSKAPLKYSLVMPPNSVAASVGNRPIYFNLEEKAKTVTKDNKQLNILKGGGVAGILNRNITVKKLIKNVAQQQDAGSQEMDATHTIDLTENEAMDEG